MTPNGNTILVTGGTSGIGLALAEAWAADGNTVIIAGRRKALLDELSARHGFAAFQADMSDPASIAQLASDVTAAHPALNVLVNNAGIMEAETLADADTRIAERTVATNLLGPIGLTAALLPHLMAQPRATVINVTSGLAFVPLTLTPTYSATKAALHSYTQSMRHQLRGTTVEVLELAPPAVRTDLMPRSRENPNAMDLDDFIAEVMGLLKTDPTPREILVQRVRFLRDAEAEGRFDAVFGMLNG
jgi:uncharacterized oxidoreductase